MDLRGLTANRECRRRNGQLRSLIRAFAIRRYILWYSMNLGMESEDADQTAQTLNLICALAVITKTYLYNFDPLKPHFYILKPGFTGVYIIFFLFLFKT